MSWADIPNTSLIIRKNVGSDHSMDSCLISTQENSAKTDSIREAMERSNPWTNIFTSFRPRSTPKSNPEGYLNNIWTKMWTNPILSCNQENLECRQQFSRAQATHHSSSQLCTAAVHLNLRQQNMSSCCTVISVRSWNYKDGGSLKTSFLAENQHATKEKSYE